MFSPTHLLVTRSKKTPVQLVASEKGFKVLTEIEWQRGSEPMFELRSRQGFFCQNIPVVGYSLQPIALDVVYASGEPSTTSAQ
ncbi:MAG: hypothetical protein KME15_12285 [Drouetiella hepatica Uher 2000/2452]|uniref:Uncharacterized protein n=1 Tax=Drouetiella hepatica Uher 2000/2452 TaxID=904376 RepID=A0A951QCP9_9CYAN|nr:hypothetical protein [Drouetiella hepatica Uher 2000/2452]